MLDLKFLRNNPDKVKQLIDSGRGSRQKADIDKWLELDSERTKLLQEQEQINKKKNELALIGKSGGDIETIRQKGKEVKQLSQEVEAKLAEITKQWQDILDWMPNIPVSESAMTIGKSETDNVVIKAWRPDKGYITQNELKGPFDNNSLMPSYPIHAKETDFKPRHHMDIGESLGIIGSKEGAAASGSRFTYILGDLAKLQYAIQQFFFKELIARNFKMMIPPLLVKGKSLYGTSHFPEGKDQVYEIKTDFVEEKDPLYLIGSSEPSNFSYYMNKTLKEEDLPVKLFAYTTCFRSEAGSWGKDTKGIKRMHQFDKIEMNVLCTPEKSNEIYEELLGINEWLLQQLKLPYQIVQKCTGDAGYLASAQQADPEVWLPSQNEFMEVMTATNTTDYQARRLNIKFIDKNGEKKFVHTLNDTGVAMGRMLIAIIDNYQQKEGSIKVPDVLQEYMEKPAIN